MDAKLADLLRTHPCYNEDAHKKFARMHLPVAPKCNIQCNYCNRKYDCSNESRPGVTSEVLTPNEAAEKVRAVKEKIPELSVVAIAGPGDPLANDETLETLELIHDNFPDLTLCLSTNGLMLPEYAEELYAAGVRFVTVTMNSADMDVSSKIYETVVWKGTKLKGRGAAERLLKNQLEGIKKCIDLGMLVKVNIVLIPGINDTHIPDLVNFVKRMGVYIVNILPLIPIEGTKFSNLGAPTPEERRKLMDVCSEGVKMMRHCRQCRADAIGLLDKDRSNEFIRTGACGSGCGPVNVAADNNTKSQIRIAVASDDGVTVNGGFGNTSSFRTYIMKDGGIIDGGVVNIERHGGVYGDAHTKNIADRIISLKDADIVIVKEIGPRPLNELKNAGKFVHVAGGDVKDAIQVAAKGYKKDR
ncbi:MAG: nitrogenase cofactor biosynthesis protein NifB [Methanomassiliicoccaceae archaeon]|jgi:nitrogen fixation protein NifB|nr:nitrogenase cofactor biosynthesis protein NifB [Methanomassiliicoccaceae archaeon]